MSHRGDGSGRLGVSIHSLYKWVKPASPNKEEKRGDEIELPVLDSPKAL
jgi:hypothetical protein